MSAARMILALALLLGAAVPAAQDSTDDELSKLPWERGTLLAPLPAARGRARRGTRDDTEGAIRKFQRGGRHARGLRLAGTLTHRSM
jgi:hypothetical protein